MEEYAGVYRLWNRVLEQAEGEANGNWSWTVGRTDEVKQWVCKEAQDWLTTDSECLRWVCGIVGRDVNVLLEQYRSQYAKSNRGTPKTCAVCESTDLFQSLLEYCWGRYTESV